MGLFIISLLISAKAFSYDFKVDGLCYNILSGNTVELTWEAVYTPYTGDIIIPSYVYYSSKRYDVVAIGDYAMTNINGVNNYGNTNYVSAWSTNSRLNSVTIPNSVTSIRDFAFSACSGLSSITIPNSVTSIGGGAFESCSGLTSIKVGSGNTKYDSRNGCNAIIETSTNTLITGCKKTMIPNSVTNIGDYAFESCSGLTSIMIPNSVKSIGKGTFFGCSALSSITIPNSVTSLGHYAFSQCRALTSIVSEIVNPFEIDESVFSDYSKSTLTVPAGTKSRYQSTYYWNKFTNIVEASEVDTSTKRTIHVSTAGTLSNLISNSDKYTIEELTLTGELNGTDFRLIRDMAGGGFSYSYDYDMFYDASNGKLTCLDISGAKIVSGGDAYIAYYDKGQGIKDGAPRYYYLNSPDIIPVFLFWNCKLTSVILPNSLISIENAAFKECRNLTSIIIPNYVTSIGSHAFTGCAGLTSITIPNSVTSIGERAFQNCSGLMSIKVENGNKMFDSRNSCNAIIETSSNKLITGCKNTIIPNTVKSIGDYAFYSCSGLTSITIPNSVTTIGDYAFNRCSGISSMSIPSSVTIIGKGSFYGCSSLTSITMPNTITTIGDYAFSGCSGLTSITIPNSVTSIGYSAFEGCNALKSVYSLIEVPFEIPSSTFSTYDEATLYVPKGTKQEYLATRFWYSFSKIDDGTEYNYDKVREVFVSTAGTLSNYISESEKYYIEKLTLKGELNGTDFRLLREMAGNNDLGKETGGRLWFLDMSEAHIVHGGGNYLNSRSIDVPNGGAIIDIGTLQVSIEKDDELSDLLFAGCFVLKNVKLPESINSIGSCSFWGCLGLDSIVIPKDVVRIGSEAFDLCRSLKKIYSQIDLPFEISKDVFDEVIYSTATLVVPAGTKSKYQSTNCWNKFTNIVESNSGSTSIVVTVKNYNREYGDANPTFGYSVSGGTLSGTPKITCSATKTSSVGTYTIKIEKSSVTNSNVTFVDGTLTVTKAPLTITAKSYTRKKGVANPTFEVTYSGFKNGETESVLTKKPIISCYATVSSPAGIYEITASGAQAENYDISYVKGTLTIVEAANIIVTAKNSNREYGEANPTFYYTVSGGTLSGTPKVTCTATKTSAVGTYTIKIEKGSVTNSNVTFVDGTLTVTKAPLTITANSYTRKKGVANPTFEVTYSGFKNGETESVLTRKPTISCSATTSSNVGTYNITVSGAQAQNYDISYVNGTLTITEEDIARFTKDGISYVCTTSTSSATVEAVDNSLQIVDIPASVSYNGKTYQVTSLTSGIFAGRTFGYVSLPSTITSIGYTTFSNSTLGALIWNANRSLSSSVFSYMAMPVNANFLLYVNSQSYAPSNVANVVVGSTARSITLVDATNTRFYCPKSFTAGTVSYTHNYSMKTGGNGKGWETIALPFDVQRIEHNSKGVLTPFSSYQDEATQRPFWLYELGSSGFRKASAIKANTPYIISMPNDSKYDSEYILTGNVTFSASNATIKETDYLEMPSSSGKRFVPAFSVVEKSSSIYALNVSNSFVYNSSSYDDGSRFISNLRMVYPFEAYMTSSSAMSKTISREFENGATGIEEMLITGEGDDVVKVYSLDGQLLINSTRSDWESHRQLLPAGVYILNGRKVVVK